MNAQTSLQRTSDNRMLCGVAGGVGDPGLNHVPSPSLIEPDRTLSAGRLFVFSCNFRVV